MSGLAAGLRRTLHLLARDSCNPSREDAPRRGRSTPVDGPLGPVVRLHHFPLFLVGEGGGEAEGFNGLVVGFQEPEQVRKFLEPVCHGNGLVPRLTLRLELHAQATQSPTRLPQVLDEGRIGVFS